MGGLCSGQLGRVPGRHGGELPLHLCEARTGRLELGGVEARRVLYVTGVQLCKRRDCLVVPPQLLCSRRLLLSQRALKGVVCCLHARELVLSQLEELGDLRGSCGARSLKLGV